MIKEFTGQNCFPSYPYVKENLIPGIFNSYSNEILSKVLQELVSIKENTYSNTYFQISTGESFLIFSQALAAAMDNSFSISSNNYYQNSKVASIALSAEENKVLRQAIWDSVEIVDQGYFE